jgi:hypothetical protein
MPGAIFFSRGSAGLPIASALMPSDTGAPVRWISAADAQNVAEFANLLGI